MQALAASTIICDSFLRVSYHAHSRLSLCKLLLALLIQ